MKGRPPPSDEAIRAARRLLEGHPHAEVVGELRWWPRVARWGIQLRIRLDAAPSSPVPSVTDWFASVDPAYPWGEIDLLPARVGGLTGTFHHQMRNVVSDETLPCTNGKICVQRPNVGEDQYEYLDDPVGQPERLLWHVNRGIEWLRDAAAGTLMRDGEPFELPDFPRSSTVVAFCEGPESFVVWRQVSERFGTAEVVRVGTRSIYAVREFHAGAESTRVRPEWGRMIEQAPLARRAAWIRLDGVPARAPYEVPATWGEFFEVMKSMGLDPDVVLRSALRPLRDGGKHFMLVGFPIPERVGHEPVVMHWSPIELPALKGSHTNGFGKREEAHWLWDLKTGLRHNAPINWLAGENWHADALQARGQTSPELRNAKVLVVGAGALGSAIAEILVREGVRDLQILDFDETKAGNLVRHTLTLTEVGEQKATEVANRLNRASPLARVTPIVGGVLDPSAPLPAQSADRNLVIDCTGSDWALRCLSKWTGSAGSVFVSVAMGRAATRLFVFAAPGGGFEFARFRELIQPWLRRDREDHDDVRFRRPGIGCWHPVFPALCSDVWLLAAAANKAIAEIVARPPDAPILRVLEQSNGAGGLVSLREGVLDGG